ncbi:uncharacterized protein LOC109831085 isoform X2 [Asparagus officinalis]|uniref:uncharacterized protein LOC109831085 isoform X2 n=1 Tax=Asparagus officinalis TaxID=4686 RepID=UPI00098E3FBE|nr:uncharacterized protein LOC109831085 isoform X2 [Asparagus officinalis]
MARSSDSPPTLPTKEAIAALLEYFVAPLLPLTDFGDEPPDDQQQENVAKQMHAVVILYNYYLQKQFPKLEVLGFKTLCKVSCTAQPGLSVYMRYMHISREDAESPSSMLSITEKSVISACNICIGLDTSKDAPDIETWPVSKIAVFLVDPTEEKCMLQFSATIQGVWSLVEKDIDASSDTSEGGVQMNKIHKMASKGSLQNEPHQSEEVLEQLAYSAAGEIADLSILERHSTYSLSHEKTTTRLYIMMYGRALSEKLSEIPIKDVISSLEGPVVNKDSTSEAEVTSVVEYYHMLPYVGIISSWLSRKNTTDSSSHVLGKEVVGDKYSLEPYILSKKDHNVNKTFVLNEQKVDIQNSKHGKRDSSVRKENSKSLCLVNGSSKFAKQENRSGSLCPQPDGQTIMKNLVMKYEFLMNGKAEDILNTKKNKLKKEMHNVKHAGMLGLTNSCHVSGLQHSLVPDGMTAMEDHLIIKRSGLSEQNLDIKSSNKKVKTEKGTIECKKNINQISTDRSVSISQIIANVSHVNADDHITLDDQAKDNSLRTGKNNEILLSKKNHVDAFTGSNLDIKSRDKKVKTENGTIEYKENINELSSDRPSYGVSSSLIIAAVSHAKADDLITLDDLAEDNSIQSSKNKKILLSKKNNIDTCKGSNLDINSSNIKVKTGEGTSEYEKNINGLLTERSSCGVSRSQITADDSHVNADELFTLEDRAKDNSFQTGNYRDISGSKKAGDPCMIGLPSAINSWNGDSPSLNNYRIVSQTKDINGNSTISDSHVDEENFIHSDLSSRNSFENKADMVDSGKKAYMPNSTAQIRACTNGASRDGSPLDGLQPSPITFSSIEHITLAQVMACNRSNLMQACSRVFRKKRDDMCQQQRSLEDEIALCEINIQTLLSEGEENSTRKADLIIEALNCFCSEGFQMDEKLSCKEECPSGTIKRRKLSEAVLTSRDPCQELDDICRKNSWLLPTYMVLPSFTNCQITGMFEATVIVEGADFGCSNDGDPKSKPAEARESAANYMLRKLRRMADVVDLDKKACMSNRTLQIRACTNGASRDGSALDNLKTLPLMFSSSEQITPFQVITSKENKLMPACLQVLQKRRNNMYQQQRLLEDEISLCEINIQMILSEGEENSARIAHSIIEAFNCFSYKGFQMDEKLSCKEERASRTTKRRKLSEAVLSSRNPCQELDDICEKNSWLLPTYRVIPSFKHCQITGMFEAIVTVKGTDFACSSYGDSKSKPSEARESAATNILRKLRQMVGS